MKKSVSIIGGGPAAIACAAFLDETKFDVTIYEKGKALGRKFLVAGKGGFNLTHAAPIADMIERYSPAPFLKDSLSNFSNQDLRDWLEGISIPTYIGSSNRVYPVKGIKPIEVLNAIQKVLEKKEVQVVFNKSWLGWGVNNSLAFADGSSLQSDITIFALGGGSWKVTGSDGSWVSAFEAKGIKTLPFQASNCAYQIDWDQDFRAQHAGNPIKNVAISCLNRTQKGEVVVTEFGLEGNAIYALSPEIRQGLNTNNQASIFLDLKPTLSVQDIVNKLEATSSKSITDALKGSLKMSKVQIALLKKYVSKTDFLDKHKLATHIKHLELQVIGLATVDEAISTVGGVMLEEVDEHFQVKKLPNHYCIGEMMDWDAPTGGYLLQACFSMGFSLAATLNIH